MMLSISSETLGPETYKGESVGGSHSISRSSDRAFSRLIAVRRHLIARHAYSRCRIFMGTNLTKG